MARTYNTTTSEALDFGQLLVALDATQLSQLQALNQGQVMPLSGMLSNQTDTSTTFVVTAPETVEAAPPAPAASAAPAVSPTPTSATPVVSVAPTAPAAPAAGPSAVPHPTAAANAVFLALNAHIPPAPTAQESTTPALVCPGCRTAYKLTPIIPVDKSWYVVFTGRKVGLFPTAQEADDQVLYVRGGARERFDTYALALAAFRDATLRGKVSVRLGKNDQAALDAKQAEERAAVAATAAAAATAALNVGTK